MSGVYGSSRGKFGSRHRPEGSGSGSRTRDGSGGKNSGSESGEPVGEGHVSWAINFTEVQLGELIATGSFGVVHSGYYRGQHVAIKFLLFAETSSDEELNRAKRGFRQEVAVWHKLQHPNVVQFIGAYINPPKWAIVTEFLEGGTVKGFLSRLGGRRKLPLKQVVSMALDIARGMQYLHSHNIIHRDLKTANLLLDTQGTVKVADFGLARVEAQEPGNMTAETGTIRWMAPEMIDHKPYTRKVDVYSFGIVLWELATAQWPFEGFSFVQLAHAIVADNMRPPTKDVPPQLVKLMTSCWDVDAEARPDFDQIVEDLEKLGPASSRKRSEDIVPVGPSPGDARAPAAANGGSTTGSSQDGMMSRHGPRPEAVADSGWKKIQVQPEKPQSSCCTIL